MIKIYKILTGEYDMVAAPNLATAIIFTTRGNNLRLQKVVQDTICVNSFFTNSVNMWNSLPNRVVHAESNSVFKTRLDKFWSNQEISYDYRAELQRNGSRKII